jgi:RNA-directed DNA polymerase
LHDLDRELEKRGHKFVPYADDCNVYVRSRRAGERVMKSGRGFLDQKLKLKVNPKKSGVEHARRVTLLGFVCYRYRGEVCIRVDQQAVNAFGRESGS